SAGPLLNPQLQAAQDLGSGRVPIPCLALPWDRTHNWKTCNLEMLSPTLIFHWTHCSKAATSQGE
ncbi:MAG: hypothetical protein WBG05_22255, partial [Thermoanaerobaculia bacterium]